jgi:hypothetical protein
MFTLLRMLPAKRILAEQLPALLIAWLIAELFYKFHSFSLECAAFLATWFVFDGVVQLGKSLWQGSGKTGHQGEPLA